MQYIIQFIDLLLSGVSNAFNFFLNIGVVFVDVLQILPQNLSSALLICFGIIVSIRVLELLP